MPETKCLIDCQDDSSDQTAVSSTGAGLSPLHRAWGKGHQVYRTIEGVTSRQDAVPVSVISGPSVKADSVGTPAWLLTPC